MSTCDGQVAAVVCTWVLFQIHIGSLPSSTLLFKYGFKMATCICHFKLFAGRCLSVGDVLVGSNLVVCHRGAANLLGFLFSLPAVTLV